MKYKIKSVFTNYKTKSNLFSFILCENLTNIFMKIENKKLNNQILTNFLVTSNQSHNS